MSRRARSLSRFRGTTPGREATPSIYEYGSAFDGTGGSGYSTRLNVYTPDLYGSLKRTSRATSVARFKDIDTELAGNNRWNRSPSVGRFDHLRARRPYSAYGTHDFDYFDRYTERIRDKTPIALDSHYTHYRPYYWYHTAPRTFYYYFPYDDWRYRPLYHYRSPALYSSAGDNSSSNYRFNDSIDRVSSLKRAMRDIDYTRELRQLRYSTPGTFSAITSGVGSQYLGQARQDVRRSIDSRVGGSGISRLNNPKDYFGRTYVQFEKNGVNNVGVRYNGLTRTVEHKPSYWRAEDNVETGYELQAQNDDTLGKLYANQDRINASREWLLEDKAGVAPRMYHFDVDTRQARRDVDNSLRTVQNLKQLKHETFNRLSQPWSVGKYLY